MFRKRSCAFMLLLLLSLGPATTAVRAQDEDAARELQSREQLLARKVRVLRAEQKQLLLRKMLYSSDSKYLEIDLRSGEGSLKYRTRVLRTFRFSTRGRYVGPAAEGGILSLTAKEDGPPAKRRLLFNNAALVVEGKQDRGRRGPNSNRLFLSIGKRDLAAIFYALEAGSIAYLKER